VQVLSQVQSQSDGDYSLRDEGVVESLQQDLGELLMAAEGTNGNIENAGMLLQMAHEHIQRSYLLL